MPIKGLLRKVGLLGGIQPYISLFTSFSHLLTRADVVKIVEYSIDSG